MPSNPKSNFAGKVKNFFNSLIRRPSKQNKIAPNPNNENVITPRRQGSFSNINSWTPSEESTSVNENMASMPLNTQTEDVNKNATFNRLSHASAKRTTIVFPDTPANQPELISRQSSVFSSIEEPNNPTYSPATSSSSNSTATHLMTIQEEFISSSPSLDSLTELSKKQGLPNVLIQSIQDITEVLDVFISFRMGTPSGNEPMCVPKPLNVKLKTTKLVDDQGESNGLGAMRIIYNENDQEHKKFDGSQSTEYSWKPLQLSLQSILRRIKLTENDPNPPADMQIKSIDGEKITLATLPDSKNKQVIDLQYLQNSENQGNYYATSYQENDPRKIRDEFIQKLLTNGTPPETIVLCEHADDLLVLLKNTPNIQTSLNNPLIIHNPNGEAIKVLTDKYSRQVTGDLDTQRILFAEEYWEQDKDTAYLLSYSLGVEKNSCSIIEDFLEKAQAYFSNVFVPILRGKLDSLNKNNFLAKITAEFEPQQSINLPDFVEKMLKSSPLETSVTTNIFAQLLNYAAENSGIISPAHFVINLLVNLNTIIDAIKNNPHLEEQIQKNPKEVYKIIASSFFLLHGSDHEHPNQEYRDNFESSLISELCFRAGKKSEASGIEQLAEAILESQVNFLITAHNEREKTQLKEQLEKTKNTICNSRSFNKK
jgi:hypothetical protein